MSKIPDAENDIFKPLDADHELLEISFIFIQKKLPLIVKQGGLKNKHYFFYTIDFS